MARSGDAPAAVLAHAVRMTTASESIRDYTLVEPRMIALYEAAPAQRGAIVAGIDATAPFVDIARERLPAADLTVGEMECLPFPDGAFDVVTAFNAFQLAADPGNALREGGAGEPAGRAD